MLRVERPQRDAVGMQALERRSRSGGTRDVDELQQERGFGFHQVGIVEREERLQRSRCLRGSARELHHARDQQERPALEFVVVGAFHDGSRALLGAGEFSALDEQLGVREERRLAGSARRDERGFVEDSGAFVVACRSEQVGQIERGREAQRARWNHRDDPVGDERNVVERP